MLDDFIGHGWNSGWGVLASVEMAAMMGWMMWAMMRGGRGGGEARERFFDRAGPTASS